MSAPWEFFVTGTPVAWARAGGGKTTQRFTPSTQRSAMAAIAMTGRLFMRGRIILDQPIRLQVEATYPWPKSWPEKQRTPWKTSRPDSDNVLKLTADALNDIVWRDDALIVEATVRKRYGDEPGIRITVEAI